MSSHDFQAVLEQKNRKIESLKKRLYNQMIQLQYYLHKELDRAKIGDIAENCPPQFCTENINVSLAINKFCTDHGVRGPLMTLYDNIYNTNERTNLILQAIENWMQEIIQILRQSANSDDLNAFLGKYDINIIYVELFNSLINGMNGMKEELGGLVNFCEVIAKTEEKRNELVEYIYSLPLEEQPIYRQLLEIQLQKSDEAGEINRDIVYFSNGERSEEESSEAPSRVRILQDKYSLEHVDDRNGIELSKMLDMINTQATSLLTLSEEQKCKYTKEIEELKLENDKLRRRIQELGKKTDEKQAVTFHGAIRKTLNEAKNIQCQQSERLGGTSTCEGCEKLKNKLLEVEKQKIQLINFLNSDDYQMNLNYTAELGIVRKTGDSSYTSQIECVRSINT